MSFIKNPYNATIEALSFVGKLFPKYQKSFSYQSSVVRLNETAGSGCIYI